MKRATREGQQDAIAPLSSHYVSTIECAYPTSRSFFSLNPYILSLHASCTLCLKQRSLACALCLVQCEKIIDINKGHIIYAISEEIHTTTTTTTNREQNNHFVKKQRPGVNFCRIDILCQVSLSTCDNWGGRWPYCPLFCVFFFVPLSRFCIDANGDGPFKQRGQRTLSLTIFLHIRLRK